MSKRKAIDLYELLPLMYRDVLRGGQLEALLEIISGQANVVKENIDECQGKVEMSCFWQSRNVAFCLGFGGVHVNLPVPVKQRRALVATNPIQE